MVSFDAPSVLPALLTPFDDKEDVVESVLRQEVRYMLSKGVHGLVPGGSAGEGNTLSTDELRQIVGQIQFARMPNTRLPSARCHPLIHLLAIEGHFPGDSAMGQAARHQRLQPAA